MYRKKDFEHQDQETQELINAVDDRIFHEDLGFSDMGEIQGRIEFKRFMAKRDEGYRLPFKYLFDKFLIAPHELTLLSGYTGSGKTELVNQILLDCLAQGAKGVITSLELTVNEIKKRLFIQTTGLCIEPSYEQNDAFFDFYSGKLKYWNSTKMYKLPELLQKMEYYYTEKGCTIFVLDNMMMLGAKPSDYDKQYETVYEIKDFCKRHPVSVFLVAHPRKPTETKYVNLKNLPSYDYEVPSIYEVSGSATIANLVDNYLALGSNTVKRYAEKEIEEGRLKASDCREILSHGDVMLKREKKREHGTLFNKELFFDVNFRRFKESFTEVLKPYLVI
jgi:KaiC/GvpD/RAD55 family RecA-like ATPase